MEIGTLITIILLVGFFGLLFIFAILVEFFGKSHTSSETVVDETEVKKK